MAPTGTLIPVTTARNDRRPDRRPEWLRRKHGHAWPKPHTKLDRWADKVVQILNDYGFISRTDGPDVFVTTPRLTAPASAASRRTSTWSSRWPRAPRACRLPASAPSEPRQARPAKGEQLRVCLAPASAGLASCPSRPTSPRDAVHRHVWVGGGLWGVGLGQVGTSLAGAAPERAGGAGVRPFLDGKRCRCPAGPGVGCWRGRQVRPARFRAHRPCPRTGLRTHEPESVC